RRATGRLAHLHAHVRRAYARPRDGATDAAGTATVTGGSRERDASPGTRVIDLSLIVITDRALAAPRPIRDVVAAALRGGAPAIQLRDKESTPAELLATATALLPLVRDAGALFFINDRLDIALAAGADGVHLGPHDLPVAAARATVPP